MLNEYIDSEDMTEDTLLLATIRMNIEFALVSVRCVIISYHLLARSMLDILFLLPSNLFFPLSDVSIVHLKTYFVKRFSNFFRDFLKDFLRALCL